MVVAFPHSTGKGTEAEALWERCGADLGLQCLLNLTAWMETEEHCYSQREAHGSPISQEMPREGKQQAGTSRDCSEPRVTASHKPRVHSIFTVVKMQTVPGRDDTESH